MRKLLLAAAVLTVAALPVAAQQPQQAPYLVLHQEIAKPSMIAQYEASTKEFIALVKANKDKMPHFAVTCLMSPNLTYTYILSMPTLATMDAVNAEFGALAQSAGAAFLDLNKRGGEATDHIRESIVQLAPELSYRPAQPRLKPEEARYHHYDLYYVMPGREPEADQLGADYAKLYKAKNIGTGYNLYKTVMGPDMPVYVAAVNARDAADFEAERAKVEAALGAEGQALNQRAMSLTRRFEQQEAVLRPDLSIPR